MDKNYETTRECFFKSYKSFIDFVTLTNNNDSMYTILVLKKNLFKNLIMVNIIIRNSNSGDNLYNEYSSNVILSRGDAEEIIDDIRNVFIDNHYVDYSSINARTYVQTLQNTNFSLNIKLNYEPELIKAIEFNKKINSKTRVLKTKK